MNVKTYTQDELKSILELHRKWLNGEEGGQKADLSYANLSFANLSFANLSDANLRAANLSDANLSDANLSDANLSDVYEDFVSKLKLQKSEVQGLYKYLLEGRVDGSTYTGECACFVGTIAKIKNTNYNQLAVRPHSASPTERFFLAIRKGDTPHNNQASEIVASWLIEFMLENEIDVPHLVTSWE